MRPPPTTTHEPQEDTTVILIAYDGSADAQAAVERGAKLLRDGQAAILSVWEPIIDVLERTGSAFAIGDMDYQTVDRESEAQARKRAQEGARYAEQAGLKAQVEVRPRQDSVAGTILAAAADLDADAILIGTRGLTGVKSLLLGSVSHAVVQHADRAVIVVPSQELSAERAAHRS
jgi:nucleotide-binding universal stress UspA family protein